MKPLPWLLLALAACAGPAGEPTAPADDPGPSWRLVQEWTGGPAWTQQTTATFTVAAPWRIRWTASGDGALFLDLYDADGTALGRVAEQQAGGAGDVAPAHPAGVYALGITSTMWTWAVAVEDAPPD